MIRGNDPILLTPGPLTTSLRTKQAMLNDWGSWDAAFNAITASLRRDLVAIVGGGSEYTCVPLQGSGTFSVEAAIGTCEPLAPRQPHDVASGCQLSLENVRSTVSLHTNLPGTIPRTPNRQ